MNMPADFGSQDDHDQPKRKSSSFLPLLILVVGLIILAITLYRFLYWQPAQQAVITNQTGGVVEAGEILEDTSGGISTETSGVILGENSEQDSEELSVPPPQEFEFYNILIGEEAQLFDRQQPAETQQENTYALVIEYFISYDQALSRSEDLVELKVKPVKVEPYMREGALSFRLRVGPYTSRSQANAMRDILYDHDIKHRLVIK